MANLYLSPHLAVGIAVMACVLGAVGANIGAADEPCVPHWDNAIGQPGMSGSVVALTVYNGDLIAGGSFTKVGGQTVNRIARWDGAAWYPFTSGGQIGVNHWVEALTEYNGDLIAGGTFTTAGGQAASYIARWDGESWSALGGGMNERVFALTVFDDGSGSGPALYAGGNFTTAGGVEVNCIARWNGESWSALGSGMNKGVNVLAVFDDGSGSGPALYAGGGFTTAGGISVNRIARWDGKSWSGLGSGVNDNVFALTACKGDLIAGGTFTIAGEQTANRIARWNGLAWSTFEPHGQITLHAVYVLMSFTGDLIAGGSFTKAGGQTVNRIARWDGSTWHPFESGGQIGVSPFNVQALSVYNGDLIAGGAFTMAGGKTANRIAAWHTPQQAGPPDLDCDGVVGVADLLILLATWGACPDCNNCPADLTGSCSVGVADLLILLANWG